MQSTIANCRVGLKPTGKLVVNIANVKSYPTLEKDFVSMVLSNGWVLKETLQLALSRIMGTKIEAQKFKYEPIFVFERTQ